MQRAGMMYNNLNYPSFTLALSQPSSPTRAASSARPCRRRHERSRRAKSEPDLMKTVDYRSGGIPSHLLSSAAAIPAAQLAEYYSDYNKPQGRPLSLVPSMKEDRKSNLSSVVNSSRIGSTARANGRLGLMHSVVQLALFRRPRARSSEMGCLSGI